MKFVNQISILQSNSDSLVDQMQSINYLSVTIPGKYPITIKRQKPMPACLFFFYSCGLAAITSGVA